jgi:prophage regulatory protein
MSANRQLTLTDAKALAERWESEGEQFKDDASLLARFRDASPAAVIRMWETGVNEDGKRLTRFEVRALVERWCEVFGCLPPSDDAEPTQTAAASAHAPADDTMLSLKDVVRITGVSASTIKRRVQDGSFPEPKHISIRRIGWQAGDVKAWLEQLDRNRR